MSEYKTVARAAAEIRSALKAKHGWTSRDVSVVSESYSGGTSIRIRIKRPGISKAAVEAIAFPEKHIRYCEVTGDILSGGNRFVFVDYTAEALTGLGAPYVEAVKAAIAATEVGSNGLAPVAGTPYHVGRPDEYTVTLWDGSFRGRFWAGRDECAVLNAAKAVAAKIGTLTLEEG